MVMGRWARKATKFEASGLLTAGKRTMDVPAAAGIEITLAVVQPAGKESPSIDARLFWILATAATFGYMLSRGIAKSAAAGISFSQTLYSPKRRGPRRA